DSKWVKSQGLNVGNLRASHQLKIRDVEITERLERYTLVCAGSDHIIECCQGNVPRTHCQTVHLNRRRWRYIDFDLQTLLGKVTQFCRYREGRPINERVNVQRN